MKRIIKSRSRRFGASSAHFFYKLEIMAREQVFAPGERYPNYIRIKGIRFRCAANALPIPTPRKGMFSAFVGIPGNTKTRSAVIRENQGNAA